MTHNQGVQPDVELFWWRGCPSWERALDMLRAEMAAAGLAEDRLRVVEIRDEEEGSRLGFPGSPTIRVRGEDVEPPGPGEPAGLTCRVYRRPDGRVSPLPDAAKIGSALAELKDEGSG